MSIPDKFDQVAGHITPGSREKYAGLLKEFENEQESYWKFEVVPDMFKQSGDVDETKFDYLKEDFGRILTWDDTFKKLDELNSEAKDNESYKIFFLARHGQGYHNLANAVYGQKAWDEKWSHMEGDGKMTWAPDPDLTELGVSQAKDNNKVWQQQITKGIRIPTQWFASPFSRSIDTLINTWDNIVDISQIKPLIKEDLRETWGVHLCDKRAPRSTIESKYVPKGFLIEDGFVEDDIYYQDDERESIEHHSIRVNRAFQFIFNNYSNDSVINITSHSGTIRSQLLVLNHRAFSIGTGGMIPVFVKATKFSN